MITFVGNALINTIVMFVYWRQNKKYVKGIGYWATALLLQTFGFLLIGIRGILPDFITIVLSNVCIVFGIFLMHLGFKVFVEHKSTNIYNYSLIILYGVLQYYFTFIEESTSIRIILISVFVSLIFLQSALLLLSPKVIERRIFTKLLGFMSCVYISIQIYRIIIEIITPTTDYFSAGLAATVAQLLNQFMTIFIVFAFIITINRVNLHDLIENEKLKLQRDNMKLRLNQTINAMAKIVELRDPYTAGHHQKAAKLASAIATELGLPNEKIELIDLGARIYDVGKIFIPTDILNKPAQLSRIEFNIVKMHTVEGFKLLSDAEFPNIIGDMAHHHHERLDGSGYPDGISGEEITIESRILAVTDVVVAMNSHRTYRSAFNIDQILEEINKDRDIKFDAQVIDACLRLFRDKGFKL
jgi:HD-GYP domain-containing protein (c-di-GMP phosphodiesterase class II)